MASNQASPRVMISLDKERTIVFDLNAMCRYEEVTGKNLFDGSITTENLTSAKDLRALLWACLAADDGDLTLEQVGALITIHNMVNIQTKLNEAIEVATPKAKKEGKKDKSPLSRRSRG